MAESAHYVLAGVMGWPVAHSRSPLMHTHWIKQCGLRGAYVALAVAPVHLETALRGLPALGFAGCNLTIPHKVAAMKIVDRVDSLGLRIGAINTIVVEADGSLTGKNTDAFGFIQSLRDAQAHWRGDAGVAVVLGAGGAARAVVAGLLDADCPEIRLCNRTLANAQSLAAEFGTRVHAVAWQERNEALRGAAVLVNTTNQGMQGESALDISLDSLPLTALVSDIVYVPLQTPLLQAAHARGNTTVNGLGMLINQARPAFEAWFGVLPDVTSELQKALEDTLPPVKI